jgi:toxin ParE1/3/4
MSAHKRRIVLSPEARSDLRDILLYTEQQWGLAQQRSYNAQLHTALAQLAQYPDLGILRPELGPRIRGLRVGQHVVAYQPSETEILILRIRHVRRDVNAEFN